MGTQKEALNPRALGGVLAVATASVMPVMLVGTAAVQISHDLHFGTAQLGLAVASYNASAALSSVPMGHLVERVGGSRVMRFTGGFGTAILLSLSLLANSWIDLTLILIGAGVISAAVQPATNLFLSRHVPRSRQGAAFGIKQAAVPFAGLLSGLAVPLVALTVGWRWAFAGASIISLIAMVAAPRRGSLPIRDATTIKDPNGDANDFQSRKAIRQNSELALESEPFLESESFLESERHEGSQVLNSSFLPEVRPQERLLPLVVLAAAFGLGIAAANCLSVFLVTSAVDSGTAKGVAGLVAALASLIGMASRIGTGIQADRRGERHLPVVAAMLGLGALGYVGLALAGHSLWLLIASAALAYGAGWGWNGLFSFAIVRVHPQFPARATGITQAGGRFGGIAGPLVFGAVAESASYFVAWMMIALVALAAAGFMLAGRRLLLISRQK